MRLRNSDEIERAKLGSSARFFLMLFPASFSVQISRAEWRLDMTIVGGDRVSTRDQDLAGQLAELKAAGCELVYREKV